MSDIVKDLHALAQKYSRSQQGIEIVLSSILYYLVSCLIMNDLTSMEKIYKYCTSVMHKKQHDEKKVIQNMLRKDQTYDM